MSIDRQEETRRATNPLFNDNRLKLGIFAHNCSHGCAISTAEGVLETTWANTAAVSGAGDKAGFGAMGPGARWPGFGGPTNFNRPTVETYPRAAGMAAGTEDTPVFPPPPFPAVHPIMAAKQATTIDH